MGREAESRGRALDQYRDDLGVLAKRAVAREHSLEAFLERSSPR
jgi:hypothetical protein